MPLSLVRIDDRLIHGQVVLGWVRALRPDRIVVANDRIAANSWERKFYTSSVPAQTSVTLFQTGNSEAFAAGFYWSSSEYSASFAWFQVFTTGNQGYDYKTSSSYVRAVRRLPV